MSLLATLSPPPSPIYAARVITVSRRPNTPSVSYRPEVIDLSRESGAAAIDDEFDRFFEQNYAAIVGSLAVAFGNHEAAAEAVQDAFIKAYARWRRVRNYDRPQAWVRKVAINRLRDLARGERRRNAAEQRAGVEPAASEASVNSESGLVALLAHLPDRQRTAMALHYVEDVSVAEIAASMGISSGAVKAHLHKGRNRLRGLAAEHEATPTSTHTPVGREGEEPR